jgi:lipopolysaccharide export LptBFGC system permease protein LptF
MSKLTTQQLLHRHAVPFAISFASLTLLLLANFAAQQVPQMLARGVSAGAIAEMLLLAVPFTIALTIPIGVFLAVLWVFTRLGKEGVLASARREHQGARRLIAPVVGAAAVMTALTFISNTEVVPRANSRLAAVLLGAPTQPSDRTMTLGELRDAASAARAATGADATRRTIMYEVEIQKKFALAAACMFLALAGAATAMRFHSGGTRLVLGVSGLVFAGYWLLLGAGESLADERVISPLLAIWMANAFILGVVLLLVWRPSGSGPTREVETLAIGG